MKIRRMYAKMNDAANAVQIEACASEDVIPCVSSDDDAVKQEKKPKLLVLCWNIYPSYVGGAEIHAHYVSNTLATNGYYVHVISVASKRHVSHDVKSIFNQSLVQLWPRPFKNLAYVIKVFSLACLRRREFDIIQVHVASTAMIAAFTISKITGKPYVVTCHGSDVRLLQKKAIVRFLQKILLIRASHVIAVSKEITDLLIRKYGLSSQYISLIPNGYDEVFVKGLLDKPSNRVFRNDHSLVFVGSLREVKAPLDLIEVFRIVSDRSKNTHLEIVGDGHLRPAVEKKIRCYKLQDRIKLHGIVPHQKALELMASAGIYVCTSVEEGLPTSLIEAMALEKAVVATDVGGIPEIIEDGVNGLLTPPRLPERMALSIERLLKDRVLVKTLGKAAAESVRSHSWGSIAQKYESIYHEVARQRNKGGAGTEDRFARAYAKKLFKR